MTSLKLARSAEDAAEHARIDSQRDFDNVQVVELKNKCHAELDAEYPAVVAAA